MLRAAVARGGAAQRGAARDVGRSRAPRAPRSSCALLSRRSIRASRTSSARTSHYVVTADPWSEAHRRSASSGSTASWRSRDASACRRDPAQPCTRHAPVTETALLELRRDRLAHVGLPSRRRVEAAELDDGARRDQRADEPRGRRRCARRSIPRIPRCASSTSSSRSIARSRRRRSATRTRSASWSRERRAPRREAARRGDRGRRMSASRRRRCAMRSGLLLDLLAGPVISGALPTRRASSTAAHTCSR